MTRTHLIYIGANALIRWKNPERTESVEYFSLGDYDHRTDQDEFGVPHPQIFYYAGSIDELDKLQDSDSGEEFVIIDYWLVEKEVPYDERKYGEW